MFKTVCVWKETYRRALNNIYRMSFSSKMSSYNR